MSTTIKTQVAISRGRLCTLLHHLSSTTCLETRIDSPEEPAQLSWNPSAIQGFDMTVKITIAVALRLRKSLEAKLESMNPKMSFSLDVDDPSLKGELESVLEKKGKEIGKDWYDFEKLAGILRKVRTDVAKVNIENGVEDLLAEIAEQDRRIRFLKKMVGTEAAPSTEALTAKIERAKNALDAQPSAAGYGYASETITTTVLSEAILERYADKLAYSKLRKTDLENQRTLKNVSHHIEIAESDQEFLRGLDVL